MKITFMIENMYQDLIAEKLDILDSGLSATEKYLAAANTFKKGITLINQTLREEEFSSVEEEIDFFKSKLPLLYADYMYYTQLHFIESNKPIAQDNKLRKYYKLKFKKIEINASDEVDFYRYLRSNKTNKDERYFTRQGYQKEPPIMTLSPVIDGTICTIYSIKVAEFHTYERLKSFLKTMLTSIEHPSTAEEASPVTWTSSKTDAIIMMYTLKAHRCLNNGQATLKQIATMFKSSFGIDVGNFSRTFQVILSRKMDFTQLFDEMKLSLTNYVDQIDDKQH